MQSNESMLYFAYGSNMCTARLRSRVPSAREPFPARLPSHVFKFHKRSDDGSGKGNALLTENRADVVWGVVFRIDATEKPALDKAEGLGKGYDKKEVTVIDCSGRTHAVFTYLAHPESIDDRLRPYTWYKRFVVDGARQHHLPDVYIRQIDGVAADDDKDYGRDQKARAVKC